MFLSDDKIKDVHFTPTLRGKQLLLDQDCRKAWQRFRTLIPLTDGDFNQYYTATLESFAEYVQNIPATRFSLYARAYGLLHLGLDRAILSTQQALKAYFDIQNLKPDQLSSHQHAELFAVFSAALLNDLGVLLLRFRILLKNRLDQTLNYDPYSGPMSASGKAFSFEFTTPELTDWQAPASLVLAKQVLAHTGQNYKNSAFAWLSQDHQILQFWYNLMLNITPRDEDETRRMFLSLIPKTDAEIFQKFMSENPGENRGSFLSNRATSGLFQDVPYTSSTDLRDETNRLIELGVVPSGERAFDGLAATDASNSRVLGSYGAANAPRLAAGLAFLRWLQNTLHHGQLLLADEQVSSVFRTDKGLVLNWEKVIAAYIKHQVQQKLPGASAEAILKDLQKLAISAPKELILRNFTLKTGQGKTHFQGLVLDNPYVIYNNKTLPALTLGLSEAPITRAAIVQKLQSRPEPKLSLE